MSTLATGDVVLRSGTSVAVVSTSGGACRSWSVAGDPVIDAGHGDPRAQYRGTILAPWPNRTLPCDWRVGDAAGKLTPTPGFDGAALHGLVGFCDWVIEDQRDDSVRLSVELDATVGYPFRCVVSATYTVRPRVLHVEFALRNLSARRCPAGFGWHPYFAISGGLESAAVDFSWIAVFEPDEQGVPQRAVVGGTAVGPDGTLALADRVWDHSFQFATPPSTAGRHVVGIIDGARTLLLRLDPRWRWLHLFSADTLPGPDRRGSLAVEPMTCPANGLQSGHDLLWVDPGAIVSLDLEIELVATR